MQGFDAAEWARVRPEIARQMLRHKFGQNASLRHVLLETGDKILVEAAPSDRIWGIGFGESSAWGRKPAG